MTKRTPPFFTLSSSRFCLCLLYLFGACSASASASSSDAIELQDHHSEYGRVAREMVKSARTPHNEWAESLPRILAEGSDPAALEGSVESLLSGLMGSNSEFLEAVWMPALAFFLLALLLSVANFPPFEGLKPMVLIMLLGCGLSFCVDKFDWQGELDVLGRSYTAWLESLDVAALKLLAFPPLLVFDVLTFDTVFAQRGSLQWLYLAAPGLVGTAALVGYIWHLYTPLDWPFSLSLAFAAALGATETGEVLTWLQDAKSSPLFELQIQGEAIVSTGLSYSLFLLAMVPTLGSDLEAEDVVVFICRNPICGLFFGLIVGVLVRCWVKVASRTFNQDTPILRSTLVIAAIYFSYAVAEGSFSVSGPFAVVGIALALPKDSAMQSQWRVLKHLAQALVMFVGGLKLGAVLESLEIMDLLHLLVVAIFSFVLRFLLVLALDFFMPALHRNRQPIAMAEACCSCWTNFHGSATLLMAMQVCSYAGSPNISKNDADHFLFFAAGMVFCTSGFQLSTLPPLLRELGIGQPHTVNFKIMHMVHSRLLQHLRAQASTVEVSVVRGLLDSAGHKLAIQAARTSVFEPDPADRTQTTGRASTLRASFRDFIVVDDSQAPTKGDVQLLLQRASRRFQALSAHKKQQLQQLAAGNRWLYQSEDLLSRVMPSPVLNDQLVESLNRIFLGLLKKQYELQLDAGVVPRRVGEILTMSTLSALSEPCGALLDFRRICEVGWYNHDDGEPTSGALWDAEIAAAISEHLTSKSRLRKLVDSVFFNLLVVAAIAVCAVWSFESPGITRQEAWLWEVVFSSIFGLEFLVRLLAGGCSWSFASLLLLLEGLLTLAELAAPIIHVAKEDSQLDLDYPARPLFAARAVALLWKWPSLTVHRLDALFRRGSSTHATKTEVLLRVVEAHSSAQVAFEDLFGPQGPNSAEVYATLALSQTTVFDALTICGDEDVELQTLTDQMQACRSNVAMMSALGAVLAKSVAEGVINPSVGDAFEAAMKHETGKVRHQLLELRSGMPAVTLPMGLPEGLEEGDGQGSPSGEGRVAQQARGSDDNTEGDGDSQLLGVLLGNSGPEVKSSTRGRPSQTPSRVPIDMLSQIETERSRCSGVSSTANSRAKPRGSHRSRGSRHSSALVPEGPEDHETSSKAKGSAFGQPERQKEKQKEREGSAGEARRSSSHSQTQRKSKRSTHRSSTASATNAAALGGGKSHRDDNESDRNGGESILPAEEAKKAGPRFSKMRTEDDEESEDGPKLVRKATSFPKAKKKAKAGRFNNIKRLFLDGGKADEVNSIQWKFGRVGAWIRNIGHGAPTPPLDSQELGPGDRLVSINGVDIRRSTKAEIEATWIQAQRSTGMLELEFEAGPEAPGTSANEVSGVAAAALAEAPRQAAAADREICSMLSSEFSEN